MNKSSYRFLLSIIFIIWAAGLVSWLLNYPLSQHGILPRHPTALTGIITAPFVHGGFYHILSNTIAFLSLGWLVSLYNEKHHNQLVKLSLFVAFWGGLLTWLLGRPHYHIGLSGVIFGYWGFITVNGIFERSIKSALISIIAIIMYGGMIFGILPTSPEISFEGHLFGAVSGIMYSYLYRRKARGNNVAK